MLQKEISECQKCKEIFSEENKPYIISCGHSLCLKCVKYYNNNNIPCFFDKSHDHFNKENNPVINFEFLSIVTELKKIVISHEEDKLNNKSRLFKGSK